MLDRQALRVLVCALTLLCLGLGGVASGPLATPVEPLAHAGRWITDASGRVIVVQGVNMVNKLPPYDLASIGFGADDVALLAREGVNAVRVGVIWAAVEPAPGQYDDGYLDSIAATVSLLHDAGIMSLLDFHQDLLSAVFQGEGFPAWAVLTDGLPIPPTAELPGSYASNAALQRAFDNFWANRAGPDGVALQDRYAAAWAHVARRFRDAPGILGFDVFNEPFPGSDWESCAVASGCPRLDASLLTPFSRRVLGAIREVDDVHIVWYEPWVLFDAGVPTAVGKLDDPRVGMSFHDYAPRDDYRLPLDNAERQSERTGDALLMTEFGATADPGVILQVLNAADRAMMSRFYWTYSNRTPFQVVAPAGSLASAEQQGLVLDPSQPLTGANVFEAKWDAFVRPYPRAVAGTPRHWSYDPKTRTFALAYATAPAGGGRPLAPDLVTEVFVPRRHYPGCYQAIATGARVVSPAQAPSLRLVNEPRAAEVTVQVTPC
jgi:endoglycosylceramidase